MSRAILKKVVSYCCFACERTNVSESLSSGVLNCLFAQDLLDKENIFSIPVLESYPQIAEDYSRIVRTPMDLATIEEERLATYESIRELQKDIVLIFRNCCSYNKTSSHYWHYAK